MSSKPESRGIGPAELIISELDQRHEFDLLALPLAMGVNFGCNGDICTQTICPIPPA
jgi:hypothetical protein